ncbi:MAG: hypothetical protein IAE96_07190 [Chitinophagaceae bacterium]|nr:hypothetical protein [Chitinophagaceae bacterium]
MNRRHIVMVLFFSICAFTCSKKAIDPVTIPPPPTPIVLQNSSFFIGNKAKNVLDTFILNYNKAVTVNYILLISNTCLPDINRTVSSDGKTVKFYNLLCASLGRDYQFQVSVKDNDGLTKIDTVKFSYYTRKFSLEGDIMYYDISNDNKYVWVTTTNPNRIVCLGIDDPAYSRSYDLAFKPRKFVINAQNQRFYILPYPFYEPNPDKIYVMNPVNGTTERVITLQPDIYDNPSWHRMIYDIEFGNNGYGVINTGALESSYPRWRVIDSRYNDTIYAHSAWINSTGSPDFKDLYNAQANYNGSKIYMQRGNAYPRGAILDCISGNITELIYANSNPTHYIITSKTQDKLFVASYAYQSIYNNSNGTWMNPSNFDNRNSLTASFSYKLTDQDVMYYRISSSPYEFALLDFTNQRVMTRTNVAPDFENIKTTTDGKYMLAMTGGGLFLWNTDIFYRY